MSECLTAPALRAADAATGASQAVRVIQREVLAERIVGLWLQPDDGSEVPPIAAGAHIELATIAGPRAYSLCNAPGETAGYRIAVLLEPAGRGGSAAVHALRIGDSITVSPPRQHFPLIEQATDSVLIAGGIGITALLPMAERLDALGRARVLHYSAGCREGAAFLSRACRAEMATSGRSVLHITRAGGGQRLNVAQALGAPAPGRHVYVCGPFALIDAVRRAADAAGWPADQVHWEHFSAPASAPSDTTAGGDRSFEVVLHRQGRSVPVRADQSVVEALAAQGIHLPVSCAQGVCGTCLTPVLSGRVDHRDLFLTPTEQAADNCFMPCCSRALDDRLVLDL